MKKGVMNLMPIEIGMSVDSIESIKFKMKQNGNSRIVEYPSSECFRVEGADIVNIVWSAEQTFMFDADFDIELDAIIKISNSAYSPTTKIVRFRMEDSLFTEEELMSYGTT